MTAALILLGLVVLVEAERLLSDPKVFFLRNEAAAAWIRLDAPFSLVAQRPAKERLLFECPFHTIQPLSGARLTLRAFRRCIAILDDKTQIFVGAEDLNRWQESHDVEIPGPLAAGDHVLQIIVFNDNAHPCLLAYSEELNIHTGPGWFVVEEGGRRRSPAIAVTQSIETQVALTYPSVLEAVPKVAPWLAGVFALAFGWTIWNSRAARSARWHIRPRLVRWILLAAWLVLAANNHWQLPSLQGFDLNQHLEYVQFIANKRALPLATDGWQMFQPPLFYLLEAPWYAILSPHFDTDAVLRLLRFLPLLCGLAQIEIVYRIARAVFPGHEDLQTIAVLVGGLLPMHIYISQVIGNEPLAGALTALTILLCVLLLVEPGRARTWRFFAVLGVIWGLALLSKVTPLLLAPLMIAAIVFHARRCGGMWRGLGRVGLAYGACFLTSGWWFLRNLAYLGKPFATGSADPVTGISWWQDPSYRTWAQLTSFGTALVRPIYGGVWSLWDALYSSMWLDGFVSGRIRIREQFPWNLDWVLSGAWLAVIPMALVLASPVALRQKELGQARSAILLALAAIVIYLAAVTELFVRLPIYSTAKATYMVGLVPCFALLAAAGAVPLLRVRVLRAALFAAVTSWAVAAYVAYFEPSLLRRLILRDS